MRSSCTATDQPTFVKSQKKYREDEEDKDGGREVEREKLQGKNAKGNCSENSLSAL